MARDYPAQFGRAPQYRNPDGTLPLPSAKNIPVPLWVQTRVPFNWSGPVSVGPGGTDPQPVPPSYDFTYTWDSPIFDLRPDLRSAQAGPKNGVPIWNTAGRLYVQLFGLSGTTPSPFVNPAPTSISAASGLTGSSVDQGNVLFANITSPAVPDPAGQVPFNSVVNIGPPETLTNSFVFPLGQPDSAVVGFAPPGTNLGAGEGYPIRYWRVQVTFLKRYTPTEETGDWPPGTWPNNPPADLVPPSLSLHAAYY